MMGDNSQKAINGSKRNNSCIATSFVLAMVSSLL
jgi:hypothetical protein